jgi:integrase
MRTLRAIINNEGSKPYLTGNKYPYGKGKYVIPTGRRRKTFITLGDVWKLEEYVTENLALVQARDMFVFMFYGSGMNFGDLCRLQFKDIQHNMEILFFREKTTKESGDEPVPVYVPLLSPMIEVINRQGNKDQTGYIFPFLNGIDPHKRNEKRIKKVINSETRKINSNLKVIASDLEIDPDLSTNYARHSYMTHLLSEEYLNDIIVKQMVGHSTNDNVTAGYNHLTTKKRKEINGKLLNPSKDYINNKIKYLA